MSTLEDDDGVPALGSLWVCAHGYFPGPDVLGVVVGYSDERNVYGVPWVRIAFVRHGRLVIDGWRSTAFTMTGASSMKVLWRRL